MKIQASQLQFQSSNQRQNTTVQLGKISSRATTAANPAITAATSTSNQLQTTQSRRSLESQRQSQHCQTSSVTTPEGQQTQFAQSTTTQSGLRSFAEQQSLSISQGSPSGAQRFSYGAQVYRSQAYYLQETHEATQYQIQGEMTLDDGRNINFNVTGNMSRSLRIEEGSGVYSGKIVQKDPLILNYGSTSAQLTEQAFKFDIDADGDNDQVSFATRGSAFLFIDRNKNGALDDGSELFGMQSGNGFAELARHDDDGNGFIDGNDAIYQQLQLFSREENGNDTQMSLASAGVGAIGLQSVTTDFEITNDWQQSYGRLRATGVAVGNEGRVMTIQQVDLTQRNLAAERTMRQAFELQPPAQTREANAEVPALPIEEALEKLRELTEKMRASMTDSTEPDSDTEPKTLMELLVDKFFPAEHKD